MEKIINSMSIYSIKNRVSIEIDKVDSDYTNKEEGDPKDGRYELYKK